MDPALSRRDNCILWTIGLVLFLVFFGCYASVIAFPDKPLPPVPPSKWSDDRHSSLPPVNYNHPDFSEKRP